MTEWFWSCTGSLWAAAQFLKQTINNCENEFWIGGGAVPYFFKYQTPIYPEKSCTVPHPLFPLINNLLSFHHIAWFRQYLLLSTIPPAHERILGPSRNSAFLTIILTINSFHNSLHATQLVNLAPCSQLALFLKIYVEEPIEGPPPHERYPDFNIFSVECNGRKMIKTYFFNFLYHLAERIQRR